MGETTDDVVMQSKVDAPVKGLERDIIETVPYIFQSRVWRSGNQNPSQSPKNPNEA